MKRILMLAVMLPISAALMGFVEVSIANAADATIETIKVDGKNKTNEDRAALRAFRMKRKAEAQKRHKSKGGNTQKGLNMSDMPGVNPVSAKRPLRKRTAVP